MLWCGAQEDFEELLSDVKPPLEMAQKAIVEVKTSTAFRKVIRAWHSTLAI